MANDGGVASLNYIYQYNDHWRYVVNASYGDFDYKESNPIYGKEDSANSYGISGTVFYNEPFGWKALVVQRHRRLLRGRQRYRFLRYRSGRCRLCHVAQVLGCSALPKAQAPATGPVSFPTTPVVIRYTPGITLLHARCRP